MSAIFKCDVNGAASAFPHFWEHTVGSDHALSALRADWRQQMRRAHDELGFRHVRFHDLLCDDVGTLISEGDKLFYSFHNADQILDFRETREKVIPVKTFTILMHDVDRAITDEEEEGFVKIHVRDGTDRILGATVVAKHAGEMINGLSLAITSGIGLRALAQVTHA